jgi:hypothetical protein
VEKMTVLEHLLAKVLPNRNKITIFRFNQIIGRGAEFTSAPAFHRLPPIQ